MSLQDRYDWVVVGNHPGALLSASLVARMGFSVLILPHSTNLPLSISRSGQYFDPESNYTLGLGRGGKTPGLWVECLKQMDVSSDEMELIRDQDIDPYVLTPNIRLKWGAPDFLDSEFHRELGRPVTQALGISSVLRQLEDAYLDYWHALPQRLTLSVDRKKTVTVPTHLKELQRRLSKQLQLNDSLRAAWLKSKQPFSQNLTGEARSLDFLEACEGLWNFITGSVHSDPTFFEMLHVFSLSRSGGTFRGGMTAYRGFLLALAKRLGAHLLPDTECRRLFVDRGQLSGIQITNRGNMISTGGGVLSSSLDKFYDRITYTGRSWLHRKRKPLIPIGWKFTVALTVHQEAIPYRIPPRLIWQEKGAPILEIEQVDPADYQLKTPSHRILYLRTHMPFTEESLKLEYQKLMASRMLKQATEIFPFLDYHVIQIFPDFRADSPSGESFDLFLLVGQTETPESKVQETPHSKEYARIYRFSRLEEIPENLLIFSGPGLGSASGIEGLFLVSGQSYPELGSLGSGIAALESAAWRAHRSGLSGPFRPRNSSSGQNKLFPRE